MSVIIRWGAVAEWVRAQVSKSRGPGFESHQRRFESWASSFTPRCLSLSETLLVYPKRMAVGVKPRRLFLSLEFGRRPTKKFYKFGRSVALYGYKLAFHPPLVRWKYMSSGYCTKLDTELCSIIRIIKSGTTFTLLKKEVSALVTRQCYLSHRSQRPLSDNKEKPQPHYNTT